MTGSPSSARFCLFAITTVPSASPRNTTWSRLPSGKHLPDGCRHGGLAAIRDGGGDFEKFQPSWPSPRPCIVMPIRCNAFAL